MEGWRAKEVGGRLFVTVVLGPTRPSGFSRDFDPDESASIGGYAHRRNFMS